MKQLFCYVLAFCILRPTVVQSNLIRWVDFNVPYESLRYAMNCDIESSEKGKYISWIDLLALAAVRTGGRCDLLSVKKAKRDLSADVSIMELVGKQERLFAYYREAYSAALGGLLGNYEIETKEGKKLVYGLKAYLPIAEGYEFSHCSDFGNERSYGFTRKHLGHDMMGGQGTPIVAIEGGVIEAMGWNKYGGWRIGIRSYDSKRYYYYAHLQKDHPFADGLAVGSIVDAGQLIGFMGRTGYSDKENVNNIETVHLHVGMQLIFDESQKECNNEIWIDIYPIIQLLNQHRCTWKKTADGWVRAYPYRDLDYYELKK